MRTKFWLLSLKGIDHLGVSGKWEDHTKMDLMEVRLEGVDWIDLSRDRDCWRALVNTVMNLRVP
jgi:hypothetical protein